jgi:CHAT domain-containing protein/tetratricopeptide (TPR) repeat protein
MNKGTGVRCFFRQSIRASRWTILIALFLSVTSAVTDGAQKATNPAKLELHKPIEAAIAAGETRLYRLDINAKQFIRVRVQQRGINVGIALLSATGTRIQETDANKNPDGEESLAAIVETAGRYQIEVNRAAGTEPGSFVITLEDLRDATVEDAAHLEVVKLLTEGKRLQESQTREARTQSIAVYQRALEQARAANDKKSESVALYELAQALRATGKHQDAIGYYEQALPILRERQDRKAEANVLNSMGIAYDSLRQKDKSLEYYERALTIYEEIGESRGRGESLNNIGNFYRTTANYKKALEYFERARTDFSTFDDRSKIVFYNNLGLTYRQLAEWQKALDSHNEALRLAEKIPDPDQQATTLRLIGQLYEARGEMDTAIETYNRMLPILRDAKNRRGEANALNLIGEVNRKRGNGDPALEYFKQSLALFQAEHDLPGVATIYNNMALVYRVRGNFQEALDYYQKVLATDREANSPKEFNGQTLNNMGQVYFYLNNLPKALELYNQALAIFESSGDRRRSGLALNNIGQALLAQDELAKALDYFERALAIHQQTRDRAGEAATLGNLAEVYRKQKSYPKALDFGERALAATREIKNRNLEALTLVSLGKTYGGMRELDKSQQAIESALALARETRDRSTEIEALYTLALIERGRGQLEQALKRIEAAIQIIEGVRSEVKQADLRMSYFAYVQQFYGLYIDLLMRLHALKPLSGYTAAALETSERARARSLLDLLAEAHADIRQGVEPALLEKERRLRRALNEKAQRQLLLLSGAHTEIEAAAIESDIVTIKAQLLEVENEIRTRSPRYAALTQPQPLTVAQIQKQVLDDDTMLLEYWLGPERSFLWAVTSDDIKSYELPARAEIEAVARRYYGLLTDPRNKLRARADQRGLSAREFAKQDEDFTTTGRQLSEMLLSPVARRLHHNRLLIIADGALNYVPFTALPLPKAHSEEPAFHHRPLVARHEIVMLPSASTLALLRRDTANRQPAPKTLAILADPVFDQTDSRVKGAGTRSSNRAQPTIDDERGLSVKLGTAAADVSDGTGPARINRLPETRREAESIAQYVPENERLEALDFDASRQLATSDKLSSYRYIHIATHGFLNSVHPESSGIVLSLVDPGGAQQSGFMVADEFYNLKLPAELVVLSACQTGLGQEVRGEGLIGLTRGLMYAGAARVVVSLWNVDDAATAELMSYFYKNLLKKEKTPSESLRDAQLKMLNHKQWSAPYFWAAFVLQGEWR